MNAVVEKEKAIRGLVETAVRSYATGFEARHVAQKDDPDGVINMKVHNPFIAALGPEVQYYSALVRSWTVRSGICWRGSRSRSHNSRT